MSAPSRGVLSLHTEAAGAAPLDAFGPFRVLHQIGAGTLGPVFRAYDSTRERLVAVKLFKLDLPPECGHQLVAEFEQLIARNLTHPAVAAPLSTGINGVSAYLVQDYVAADSLDLAIREHGPAPAGNALRVAAQLAAALDFAAAASVTHGAVHPRDVLLSADDTRLTGLGVTRALERIGVVAPVRRPYTAPERIAGGEWDRRADIFSFAAMMHELIWGRRVSGLGAQAADSLTDVAGANLDLLREVFARALAEQPADRFETAVAFADALAHACPNAIADEDPVPAPRHRAAVQEIEPRLPLDGEPEAQDAPIADLALTAPPVADADADAEVEAPAVVVEPEPAGRRRPSPKRKPRENAMPIAMPPEPAPQPEQTFNPADLDLTPVMAEPEIRRAPALDIAEVAAYEAPASIPHGLITGYDEPLSALERTRSAVWPLLLALVVGLAIGFAGGFFAGGSSAGPREQVAAVAPAPTPAPAAAPPAASVAASPAAKEFTEGTVAAAALAPKPAKPALKSETRNLKSAAGRAGSLAIVTRPAGASVYLDGKLVGKTPLNLPSVAVGSHAIRLAHNGYRRWASSVKIAAGEQHKVTASLER